MSAPPPSKLCMMAMTTFGLLAATARPDAAGLRRQSAAQLFPTSAAVRAFENAANVFAVRRLGPGSKTPRRSLAGVKRSVNNLRIVRIQNDLAAAGARVVRSRGLQN